MGIKQTAAVVDALGFVENLDEFGWPITITSPAGVATSVVGYTTDIAESVDPETNIAVASRKAQAVVSLLRLPTLPTAVLERGSRPWLVAFADVVTGVVGTWKVVEVLPDRAIGLVILRLESWRGAD